ncbi:MAG: chemotaxis protein CheA [Deltaproteobacteria bacterium]|nr:chemotaxis protein CheA [Deltaproteobacteria bacterium]
MDYSVLCKPIDDLASDLVFLDGREIDIPSSGKFMNRLEEIVKAAEPLSMATLTAVANALNHLLEKMVFDALKDKEEGFSAFEKGIALMQTIAQQAGQGNDCRAEVQPFLENIVSLTGVSTLLGMEAAPVQDTPSPAGPTPAQEQQTPAPEEKTQISDLSLAADFVSEGLEYIDEIEVNILNLEQNPEDMDCINAIFRPFHSIKGVAGFLNLEKIRDLAHNLENLLDKARNNELRVAPALIDVILDGADALKALILRLKDEIEGQTPAPLQIDLAALLKRVQAVEKGEPEIPAKQKLGEILISEGVLAPDDVDQVLMSPKESSSKKIGEILIEEGKATTKQVSQALRKQAEQSTDSSTLRVDTRKLDDLIDMVGELVITQSMIQQDLSRQVNADKSLMRDIALFFRITSSLQRTSMSLRMIPIRQTFQRMARLIRDLAKKAGKSVNVEMVGEETEIDRNMVDEIYNPLVHMVRNAVDHGLETPEERVKAGKPEKGTISLKAYHRGGNIVIEISDDGRGLNRKKILEKALEKRIITEAGDIADQDVYRMILLPGLSTAEKITDVSGRGVGMDVVKQSVEKLRGKMDIESKPGKGTTFITRFPLTLAIIDGMLVKVGQEIYIVPTMAVRRTLRPSREQYNVVVNKGETINVMGQLLSLVRLADLLGEKSTRVNPWEGIVVVVEGANRTKCLLVDEVIGKAEVVIKSLGSALKYVKGVSGGAILGDGRVGLILDPEGLFELSEGK